MKIVFFIWTYFIPFFIQNIIKYFLFGKNFTFSQIQPFSIASLRNKKSHIHPTAQLDPHMTISGNLIMGRYSYMKSPTIKIHTGYSHMVVIGNFCSIASGVQFQAHNDHDYTKITTSPMSHLGFPLQNSEIPREGGADIRIDHDVWIGMNAIILPGVHIGTGAVVGAGAVVTSDIPPYAIVGGVPAKIIKYRFNKEMIQKLIYLEWWNWDIDSIRSAYDLENIK